MLFTDVLCEGIVGFLALMTSAAVAAISFYTFKLQRDHNIKSVKPIVHVGQWDYEDRLFVTLKNVGAGIAVVKKLTVYNTEGESKQNIYHWLPSRLPGNMNYKEYWTPYSEFVIQPNEVIKLIEVTIDTSNYEQKNEREKLRKILGELTVEVIYNDIYENLMPKKKLTLSHFLRTDNEN